jgi:hypothetical protein
MHSRPLLEAVAEHRGKEIGERDSEGTEKAHDVYALAICT